MVGCYSYDNVALVEQHVAGVELAVSVIDDGSGPIALPAVEIEPLSGTFDYAARYTAGMTEYHVPARLDSAQAEAARSAAVLAHVTLGLRDLSRTDLIVDASGQVHYFETNVAPGMTTTSLLPLAAAAAGLDLGTLCRDLLHLAVLRGRVGSADASSRSRALRGVSAWRHGRHDAVEIVDRRELDGDLAAGLAQVDPHPGLEVVGQPGREFVEAGRPPMRGTRPAAPGGRSSPTATSSSTARTDRPSAMIRCASASWAPASSRESSARACPAESTPAATLRCTDGGRLSSRMVLLTCDRERPMRRANSSCVTPNSSRSCA